jgi:MFS family permease
MTKTRQLFNVVLLEFLKKFSGDIYIIALPAIAASLNTQRQHVQIMVSLFLIGAAVSQLICGSLSDNLGRRRILLSSLLVFIVGAFTCASFTDLSMLLVGIFVMGLGIGAAPVIGKAIIFDLYHKSGKTALFLVITSAFVVWAPAVAMAIGGNVSHYFGWHFVFHLSGVFGIVAWIVSYFYLPKTVPTEKPQPGPMTILHNYSTVLSNLVFSISLLGLALTTSMIFIFYTAGYFIMNHTLHIPLNIIGYFTFLIVGGNFCGKFLGGYFSLHLKERQALFISSSICALSASFMFVAAWLHFMNVYTMLGPMMVYMFGLGSLMPVARTYLMHLTPKHAGTSAGITGIAISLTASFVCLLVSHFSIHALLPMATLMIFVAISAWVMFMLSFRLH